jgi:hypothetical protein
MPIDSDALSNPLAGLQLVFLNISHTQKQATIILGADPSDSDLWAAIRYLRDTIPHDVLVTPTLDTSPRAITVQYTEDNGVEEAYDALRQIVTSSCKVLGSASVRRQTIGNVGDQMYVGVRIEVSQGSVSSVTEGDITAISNVHGVVIREDRHVVVFTVPEGDSDVIRQAIYEVASTLGLFITRYNRNPRSSDGGETSEVATT